MKTLTKNTHKLLLAFLILGIGITCLFGPVTAIAQQHTHSAKAEKTQRTIRHWTCSMHPQIKQASPGKCPICGMDLIPIYENSGSKNGETSLTLSKRAQKLASVATTRVSHRPLNKEIYTVGKIDYNEGSLAYVSARIGGRIDKLFADFTGIRVKKGEHLVLLYSPELMSAQEEYLLALRDRQLSKKQSSQIAGMFKNTLAAARGKLLLYGITKKQLTEIERKGKVQTHLTIYAPISGTVINKKAIEGMYVKTGDPIYTIADLSQLWLFLDIYEYDLSWVKFGQPVTITTEAYPGETFCGTVTFIDPFLNEKTRTVKVRVNVPNPDGRLRPGMYTNARIKVQINETGQVVVAGLEGKYMCPMHPAVIRDKKLQCPICGMDLEPIGGIVGEFASHEPGKSTLLSIPRSAVLDTGKRKLVYVELSPGEYSPREVKLGPVAEDYYPVIEGLKEGEIVVTSGNFLIDSQMQLAGKPSLMFPEGVDIDPHATMGHSTGKDNHAHEHKQNQTPKQVINTISQLLKTYYAAQQTLARDSLEGITNSHDQLQKQAVKLSQQSPNITVAHKEHFISLVSKLQNSTKSWNTKNIKTTRKGFEAISSSIIALVQGFYKGQPGAKPINKFYCSMRPGYWLQANVDIRNPYYGSSMLKCGELLKD